MIKRTFLSMNEGGQATRAANEEIHDMASSLSHKKNQMAIRTYGDLDEVLGSGVTWDESVWARIEIPMTSLEGWFRRTRRRASWDRIWALAPQVSELIQKAKKLRDVPRRGFGGCWWYGSIKDPGLKNMLQLFVGPQTGKKGAMGTELAEEMAGYAIIHALGY